MRAALKNIIRSRPLLVAILSSLGTPFLFGLYNAFVDPPYDFIADVFELFLVLLAYPAAMLLIVVILLSGGSRRHVAGGMMVLATLLVLVLAPPARAALLGSGEYVRLATTLLFAGNGPQGTQGRPRMSWTRWHTVLTWMSPAYLEFLVYDESDELALPHNQRSTAWQMRALKAYRTTTGYTEGPLHAFAEGRYQARRLLGHYYIVGTF